MKIECPQCHAVKIELNETCEVCGHKAVAADFPIIAKLLGNTEKYPFNQKIERKDMIAAIAIVIFGCFFIYFQATKQPEKKQAQQIQTPVPQQVKSVQAEKTVIKTYREGETVHVGYTAYAVSRSWWANTLTDNKFLNERPNASFLFVEVSVENNDKKPRSIPPFKIIDDSGNEYETSSLSWRIDNSIGILESLNPGVAKRGLILFDLPVKRGYSLKASGGYWSKDDALIKLSP